MVIERLGRIAAIGWTVIILAGATVSCMQEPTENREEQPLAMQEDKEPIQAIHSDKILAPQGTMGNELEVNTAVPEAAAKVDAEVIKSYWDGIAEDYHLLDMMLLEWEEVDKPQAFLLEGLNHSIAEIRWYCTYKLVDDPALLDAAAISAIRDMRNDEQLVVRQAANFAVALIDHRYSGSSFVRSQDGSIAGFYKYRESRYNDGKVWMVKENSPKLLGNLDGSVFRLSMSASGRWLEADYGGRTWSNIAIFDTSTGNQLRLPNLIEAIIDDPDNNYDIHPESIDRFDPAVWMDRWLDNDRFRFAYQFYDSRGNLLSGRAIYDTTTGTIERVMKFNRE
ncbi:hypothetical protein K0T92_19660 [Paenibacillus oenotherae]|uniref:Lipoprotein n=1 Tax=Paenibacillus oenotherae TaxID=1435645 RepID=A0ABS7DB11_9BACL|nr:hypothetical protein [Paenibacillus oenotherae]MBW7476938.1 hypothetical protein [Paenibacillus oenotherae]